jgi:transcriptional regulator with XRE-family HTH domain
MLVFDLLRRDRRLTFSNLEERTGIKERVIQQIARGRTNPNERELTRLADVFGVPPAYLMLKVEPPPVPDSEKESVCEVSTDEVLRHG